MDENEIKQNLAVGIKAFTEIVTDAPVIPCISCERLFSRKSIKDALKLKSSLLIPELLDYKFKKDKKNYLQLFLDHCEKENISETTICETFLKSLKSYKLPSMCVLNNLSVPELPVELIRLNNFEKMLIQRMKAFQTVVKMNTVAKKNLPHHVKIDKVQGRTFHLMLPLDETLKKICPDTDPLNIDTNIFIVVRSNPTKKTKVIWEDLVDIKKIWKALYWLKANNPLYAQIFIPATHEELMSSLKSQQLQYEVQNKVNNNDGNEETINYDKCTQVVNNKKKLFIYLFHHVHGQYMPFCNTI